MKRFRTCDRCRFAARDDQVTTQVWCHYGPPTPVVLPGGSISFLHSAMALKGWCGAWKLAWSRLFKGYGA